MTARADSPSPIIVVSGIPSCVAIAVRFGAIIVRRALVSMMRQISPLCWHLMAT